MKKHIQDKTYTFEELLNEHGYIVYTNVGYSMMPLLRQRRDIIEIRAKKPGQRFEKYDAVLYKRGEQYILHRIIQVRERDYVICGDHNIQKEYGITDEHILGVMTRVIRNGKNIDCQKSMCYRLYVHLWVDFFPIKAFIMITNGYIRAAGSRVKQWLYNLLFTAKKGT